MILFFQRKILFYSHRVTYARCHQSSFKCLLQILLYHQELSAVICRKSHGACGNVVCPNSVNGMDHLHCPRLNKGLAFTFEERQQLGIHGLMPPRYRSQEDQVELCRLSCLRYKEDLNRYLYLTELQERNERLFFKLIAENVDNFLPIVYTPTVGLACQKFGVIYRRPRGLFITIHDKGHVFDVVRNWPEEAVRAVVVTDGERVLGLGDLGANGMGIPVGKLSLYTALGRVPPHQCLPVTLDVGTNNQASLEDPLYIGLKHARIRGADYENFIDEFMQACVKRFGQNVLIQFEDFANHNAFRLLTRYRDKYCTFNDDIQGTAAVAVAGLYASQRITKKKISDHKILFLGAGEAAVGIADLAVRAMEKEGIATQEARNKIWMMDIDGLLAKGRPEGNIGDHQAFYAKDFKPTKDFLNLVKEIKPSVLIGVSATGGMFTPEILQQMASFNERPVVFSLSNPTSKSECTAEQAYQHTQGKVVFCSGSPFPPVVYEGKTYKPGQGNNAYIFPGLALGVIVAEMHHIKEDLFLIAAKTVSDMVDDNCLSTGSLFPPLKDIHEVSIRIATNIAEYAFANGLSSLHLEPQNKRKLIESTLYDFNYHNAVPSAWRYPDRSYIM